MFFLIYSMKETRPVDNVYRKLRLVEQEIRNLEGFTKSVSHPVVKCPLLCPSICCHFKTFSLPSDLLLPFAIAEVVILFFEQRMPCTSTIGTTR